MWRWGQSLKVVPSSMHVSTYLVSYKSTYTCAYRFSVLRSLIRSTRFGSRINAHKINSQCLQIIHFSAFGTRTKKWNKSKIKQERRSLLELFGFFDAGVAQTCIVTDTFHLIRLLKKLSVYNVRGRWCTASLKLMFNTSTLSPFSIHLFILLFLFFCFNSFFVWF